MATLTEWKQIKRKEIYNSRNLQVFEDEVLLPDGTKIDDYSLIQKKDVVMVVAINQNQEIACLLEYKYAAAKWLNTLPAGQVKKNENPIEAGKRELLEETGFGKGKWQLINTLYEYPSKDLHWVSVVLAQDVELIKSPQLEKIESIANVRWLSKEKLQTEIKNKKWLTTSVLSSLFLALFD